MKLKTLRIIAIITGTVVVLGHLLSDSPFQTNGTIIFVIITFLLAVSLIKSFFQLYLHKTS